jgi:hypothetical protein
MRSDYIAGDGLPNSVRPRPFGGGMPDQITAKARKSRKAFEDRLERVIREARARQSK